MEQLVAFLYEQRDQDSQLAYNLTRLELANLTTFLRWSVDHRTASQVVDWAGRIEGLLEYLGVQRVLDEVVSIRTDVNAQLDGSVWSDAHFLGESISIDRLLERGDLKGAYETAQRLLERCLLEGEDAYDGADYDIAVAYFRLGRVLRISGNAQPARKTLMKAERRFDRLSDDGNTAAERMASIAIGERAACLRDLGKLNEAEAAYKESIRRAEKLDDQRQVAVCKSNLGTVYRRQGRSDAALAAHTDAKGVYSTLGEPKTVAICWHQIGVVHQEARQFRHAEEAYRQSLALSVSEGDKSEQASTLNGLGYLYAAMGRTEESISFFKQAADIHAELRSLANEGKSRSNLASEFIKLKRNDEARRELQRAIECKAPFGHAVEMWKTWNLLYDLENACNHPDAAKEARQKAISAYESYRRDGGVSQHNAAQLYEKATEAVKSGKTGEIEALLKQLVEDGNRPDWLRLIADKLLAILHGKRNPGLAEDPLLSFWDAVELKLLLERLAESDASRS